MKIGASRIIACCLLLGMSLIAAGDDDGQAPDTSAPGGVPTLNAEQLRAVGIVVAHPLAAKAPGRFQALGLVLDPTTLVADLGDQTSAGAAEHSASAEVARLRTLYGGGAGASLRMLEAAQAEQAKSEAQMEIASARFALHWGALAALPADARQKLIQASVNGRSLLMRADMPGRHTIGELPGKALLDVDGIQVPGRVLGILRQTTELQSVGLLIEVPSAPAGLGPGARVPVALLNADQKGWYLPREAVLYDENGAYVYKQLTRKTAADKARYAPVKVNLQMPYGEGWLVDGVDDDDNIVVHGAGVLWSLQGMGTQQPDDDDD
jgi:hypothetical protein